MTALRRLALDHRRLSACVLLAALLMKLLVPAGFMPTVAHGAITISICSGKAPDTTMTIAMPDMPDHGDPSKEHRNAAMPCAFAGLGLAALAAVDPLMLAVAIAFVMATGFAAVVRLPAVAPAHLRPPLRGPPAAA